MNNLLSGQEDGGLMYARDRALMPTGSVPTIVSEPGQELVLVQEPAFTESLPQLKPVPVEQLPAWMRAFISRPGPSTREDDDEPQVGSFR